MAIDALDKLVGKLQALTREEVKALSPAERRRLIEALIAAHRVAISTEMTPPSAGLLADLKDPRGRE
jgi:hypothetical protein